jgi:hypothetical protein
VARAGCRRRGDSGARARRESPTCELSAPCWTRASSEDRPGPRTHADDRSHGLPDRGGDPPLPKGPSTRGVPEATPISRLRGHSRDGQRLIRNRRADDAHGALAPSSPLSRVLEQLVDAGDQVRASGRR